MSEESAMIYVCTDCRQNNLADEFLDETEFNNHVDLFHRIKSVMRYRRFKCNLCKFESKQKFHFNNHFEPQELVTCCNIGFTVKCTWYTHIQSVHDGKWSCFECSVNCIDSVGLKNHLRGSHKKNIDVGTISKSDASLETEADASVQARNASGQTGNALSVPVTPPAAYQSSLVSRQPQTHSSPEEEMPLNLSTRQPQTHSSPEQEMPLNLSTK